MTVTIRRATSRDADTLQPLVQRAYRGDAARAGWTHEADLLQGERIGRDELADLIANPSETILLAERAGAIIGCVRVANQGNGTAYLGLLCVEPALQATGLGRRLIDAAEEHARELGASRMEMTVIDTRHELIAYYHRRGYARTGTCDFPFVVDPPLSMVVLARALG